MQNSYTGGMLALLKQALEKKYKLRETKGLFVSGFDAEGKLQYSQGIVETDQPLEKTLESLYKAYVEPTQNTKVVALDVVTTLFEETNISKFPSTSPKLYGLAVSDEKGGAGVILPGTKGVADAKHALFLIKEKNALQGKVKIYVFTTDRLLVVNEGTK